MIVTFLSGFVDLFSTEIIKLEISMIDLLGFQKIPDVNVNEYSDSSENSDKKKYSFKR